MTVTDEMIEKALDTWFPWRGGGKWEEVEIEYMRKTLEAALSGSPAGVKAKPLDGETLRPLHEAVNTRSHVKISPSQASRILSAIEPAGVGVDTPPPQPNVRDEPFADLVASARAMIESLDCEAYISPETCELINLFDRKLEAAFPSVAPECAAQCQYAKDVGMLEYICSSRCQYLDRPPSPQPREAVSLTKEGEQ